MPYFYIINKSYTILLVSLFAFLTVTLQAKSPVAVPPTLDSLQLVMTQPSVLNDDRQSTLAESGFFTNPAFFACPTPLNPYTSFITPSSVQLNWSSPSGNVVDHYEIQYRAVDSGICTGNVTQSSNPWINWPETTTGNALSLTGLPSNTCYQWQVRSICATAEAGSYTQPVAFKTLNCNSPTNLIAVGFSGSANLQWTTPTLGSIYELQWRQQGNPAWNTIGNLAGDPVPSSPNQIKYTLTGLNSSTAYEYQVRLVCSASSSSAYTSPFNFTTTSCSPPTSGGITTRTATTANLFWSPGGAANYTLRWRPQGSTNWITINNIASSNFILSGLTPSTAYEFQVQAICSEVTSSTFSSSFTFNTLGCSAPGLFQALVTPTTARLEWTASASTYTIQYRAMPAGSCTSNATGPSNPFITISANQPSNNFILTGLTAGTCYQWLIISACGSNTYTSTTGYFTTGCAQAPTGTNTTFITGTTAQLNWNDLGSGVQYEVQWRVNTNNNLTGNDGCINNTTSTANPWTTISNVSSNSAVLTGLNLSTCYQWRVRVICDGSIFSNILAFRTTSTPPTCPSITQQPPSTGAVKAGGSISTYLIATGTPPLLYQWYKGGTAAGNLISNQTSATLTFTNAQLSDASTYYCLITNDCGNLVSNGFTLTVNPDTCPGGFYTVQNGPWGNTSTWSCGQIPTSTDAVEIRHIINIPANYTGLTSNITYTNSGKIVFAETGKVKIGP